MIGPGWMPSRPRPLARRKVVVCSAGCPRRRRTRRPPGAHTPRAAATTCIGGVLDLGRAPAPLPTATLHATTQGWHRIAAGDLQRWLAERWLWLRPRTVPILVAFAAMLAMLDAAKHLALYAHGDDVVRIEAARPMPRYAGSREVTSHRVLLVPSTPGH